MWILANKPGVSSFSQILRLNLILLFIISHCFQLSSIHLPTIRCQQALTATWCLPPFACLWPSMSMSWSRRPKTRPSWRSAGCSWERNQSWRPRAWYTGTSYSWRRWMVTVGLSMLRWSSTALLLYHNWASGFTWITLRFKNSWIIQFSSSIWTSYQ